MNITIRAKTLLYILAAYWLAGPVYASFALSPWTEGHRLEVFMRMLPYGPAVTTLVIVELSK